MKESQCLSADAFVEWMEGHVSAKLVAIEKKLDAFTLHLQQRADRCASDPWENSASWEDDFPENSASFPGMGSTASVLGGRPGRASIALKIARAVDKSAQRDEAAAAELPQHHAPSFSNRRQGTLDSLMCQAPQPLRHGSEESVANEVRHEVSTASRATDKRLSITSLDSGEAQLRKIQRTITKHKFTKFRERQAFTAWAWEFIDNPYSSRAAYGYSMFVPLFVGLSVLVSFVQTIEDQPLKGAVGESMQTIFESFFALELIVRFLVCPHRRDFFKSVFNWIDLVSALPLALRIVFLVWEFLASTDHGDEVLSVVAVVPLLRLMKLTRRFEKFQLLLSAFKIAIEALPVLLYTLMLIALIFSALIYFVEQDNLASLPTALWFTIVTMTTVGYGDVTPSSTWGHLIAAALMIVSALYMAIPIGIVGNAFSQVWGDRDRLLLMQRMRHAFVQGGFTPDALAEIFSLFDTDGSGELDIAEFCVMLKVMQINIGKERVFQLFEDLDKDGLGCISLHTLIHGLFPQLNGSVLNFQAERHSNGQPDPPMGAVEDMAKCPEVPEVSEDDDDASESCEHTV